MLLLSKPGESADASKDQGSVVRGQGCTPPFSHVYMLPAECPANLRERRGESLSTPPSFSFSEGGERDVGLPEHVVAERVLDGARRREFRDGIRVPGSSGRGRIGRRRHRRGRLMLVGRLPRGGRRDGIFRLGTRPGRRRRRRRRRGGSRARVLYM